MTLDYELKALDTMNNLRWLLTYKTLRVELRALEAMDKSLL